MLRPLFTDPTSLGNDNVSEHGRKLKHQVWLLKPECKRSKGGNRQSWPSYADSDRAVGRGGRRRLVNTEQRCFSGAEQGGPTDPPQQVMDRGHPSSEGEHYVMYQVLQGKVTYLQIGHVRVCIEPATHKDDLDFGYLTW